MRILQDISLNNQLLDKGFVKISLLNKSQISELSSFYKEEIEIRQKKATQEFFHTTSMTHNPEIIQKVNSFLREILTPELNKHLYNYNFATLNFFVKEPSLKSYGSPHLDWTYVDESRYLSFNVWVCLEDANSENGNMQFLQGSHKFNNTLRVNPWRPHYFNEYLEKIPEYLIDVPTKAGECLIFPHSIIHASRINTSGESRVSCVATVFPKDAELLHFHWPPDAPGDKIEKYRITPQSLIEMNKGQRPPHSDFIEFVTYDIKDIPYNDFKKLCRKNTPYRYILKNKLRSFFNLKISS